MTAVVTKSGVPKCAVCGCLMKPSRLNRVKTPTCGYECASRWRVLKENNMLYVLGEEIAREYGGDPDE